MARTRSVYACTDCGYQTPKWLGRCPDCGEWNTLTEGPDSGSVAFRNRSSTAVAVPAPVSLTDITGESGARVRTGLPELDRVLGGGLVPGSLVLLGGEPGIGKSTLLLQALLALEDAGVSSLLITGEESAAQVKMRAERLEGPLEQVRLVAETRIDPIVACLEEHRPRVCVVDSIQTLWSDEVSSAPGSVSQVREVTGNLLRMAKEKDIALVLVGHVTKDGALAGPRVLEHMVDAVLTFEGERTQPYRILRAVKNRFGSTNEIGVFQMSGRGLEGVPDPSTLFLEEGDALSGSAAVAAIEGTRCILAEAQALVTPSPLATPRRVARGVDRSRMSMIVAVLSRRAGLHLGECDIFVNLAGGLALDDPGADAPVALAVASAWRDRPIPSDVAAFGEISLTGRVRYVGHAERRVRELSAGGFRRILAPPRNCEELSEQRAVPPGIEVTPIEDVRGMVQEAVG